MDPVALSAVISAVLSGIISYLVAWLKVRSEIKKLKLTWNRQDTVSEDFAIETALSSVSLYLHADNPIYREEVLARLPAVLPNYTGPLAAAFDALYKSVADDDREQASIQFMEVSRLYRQRKTSIWKKFLSRFP